jgi:hypothetical protein
MSSAPVPRSSLLQKLAALVVHAGQLIEDGIQTHQPAGQLDVAAIQKILADPDLRDWVEAMGPRRVPKKRSLADRNDDAERCSYSEGERRRCRWPKGHDGDHSVQLESDLRGAESMVAMAMKQNMRAGLTRRKAYADARKRYGSWGGSPQ